MPRTERPYRLEREWDHAHRWRCYATFTTLDLAMTARKHYWPGPTLRIRIVDRRTGKVVWPIANEGNDHAED